MATFTAWKNFSPPNMQIRNDVRHTLAAKLDDSQLIMAGERIGVEFDEERIGAEFDEEIDKAQRGGDGGGGM